MTISKRLGLAFWTALSMTAFACGGSTAKKPAAGACTVGSNQGCGTGMVCQDVAGGAPACFCDAVGKTGCGSGLVCEAIPGGNAGCFCDPDAQTGCASGQVCEQIVAGGGGADSGLFPGTTGCFAPISVSGKVFDLATTAGIASALVVARDVNDVPVSGLAKTDTGGNYTLAVPTPRTPDGKPVSTQVTLRADAGGYLGFPKPPRVALPIDLSLATGNPLVLKSTATDIGLIALPNASSLGTISGHVVAGHPWGTVVVAGGTASAGGGVTGIADHDGSYTVFNVPAGAVAVKGYKQFLQLDTAQATVTAGQVTQNVDLHEIEGGGATQTVSGSIDVVNPGNGNLTSVILAVDETFDPNVARGEAPPGLKVSNVSNTFKIDGVPNGNYVVLAAFENDFLVRDPDTSISGTSIVHITVPGNNNPIGQAFKVTGSLDHPSPDAEQVVSGTPTFTWDDDSGEDHYEIRVFDAFGTKVWENLAVPGASGKNPSVTYGGPALTSGMLYQFRAVSIKLSGAPLSSTEDLRGTFIYK